MPKKVSTSENTDAPVSQLRKDYESQKNLYAAQPPLIQRFMEAQACQVSEAIMQHLPQVRFSLPDRVIEPARLGGHVKTLTVPAEFREQMAGGLLDRFTRTDLRSALRQRIAELEGQTNKAVVIAAGLMRHAIVVQMIYHLLPSGRTVNYEAVEGEEIPTIPVQDDFEPESAITAASDAIAEDGQIENGRGELLVPFVPAARRFFLPQWVAFDDHGRLLVNSANEAEAHVVSMQRFLNILHSAVAIAPYIVADETYQQKRYGMLGQLLNQGRALAFYQTGEIIRTIKRRAATQDLNRGLSLSLPYFDDQDLEMKAHEFEVIPAGRIMFVPAFVVRAAREEQVKVSQDTRLNPSTRKYLLIELKALEEAFTTSTNQ